MPRPLNALIVDDEAHVRLFLRLLLSEVGIRTAWQASNGEEALAMTAQYNPDLVLLDINMPVMNGVKALARLRETNPDLPIVVVSSDSAVTTVREAARLGAAGYILKQSPKADGVATLREIIESMEDSAEDDGASDES